MGYGMDQLGTQVFIAAENVEACTDAILAFTLEQVRTNWHCSPGLNDGSNWALEDALGEWSWTPRFDTEGNVVDLVHEGDKLINDGALFSAIAPYVAAGSFIVMAGEDLSIWRWFFDGEHCLEEDAELTFPCHNSASVDASDRSTPRQR